MSDRNESSDTSLEVEINSSQASCLRKNGLCVIYVNRNKEIQKGQKITPVLNGGKHKDAIVIAIQKSRSEEQTYIIALTNKIKKLTTFGRDGP